MRVERLFVPKNVLSLAGLILGTLFLVDAAFFRSGLYARVVSPVSTVGIAPMVIRGEKAHTSHCARRIVALGDSRLSEGLSAKTAATILQPGQISLSNIAIPGSTPRDWFYILRDLDPERTRYNVIALPLVDYADFEESSAARLDDLNYVIGLLRLSDISNFAASYPNWRDRWEVCRGSLFKGLTYRRDLRDFLKDPSARLQLVKGFEEHGWEWGNNYGGKRNSLAGLRYDAKSGAVEFPPGTSAGVEQGIRNRLNVSLYSVSESQRAYLTRWLGAIESLYRGKDVRFILYRMSQCPIRVDPPEPKPPDPLSAVNLLRKDKHNIVLDEHVFDSLERPEYFADDLHLNAVGRAAFSEAFAHTMLGVLGGWQGSGSSN